MKDVEGQSRSLSRCTPRAYAEGVGPCRPGRRPGTWALSFAPGRCPGLSCLGSALAPSGANPHVPASDARGTFQLDRFDSGAVLAVLVVVCSNQCRPPRVL